MNRLAALALCLALAACAATPEQAARDNKPNNYLPIGERNLNAVSAGPMPTPPGITSSSAEAGKSFYGPGNAPPESYYGTAPLPTKVTPVPAVPVAPTEGAATH